MENDGLAVESQACVLSLAVVLLQAGNWFGWVSQVGYSCLRIFAALGAACSHTIKQSSGSMEADSGELPLKKLSRHL